MSKSWDSIRKQLDELQTKMAGNPLMIEIREYNELGDNEILQRFPVTIDGLEAIVTDIEKRGHKWSFRILEGNSRKELKILLDFITAGIKENFND